MIRTPKTLQTRADFDAAISLAATEPSEKPTVLNHLKGLIEGAYQYNFDRNMTEEESADGSFPDFWVVEASEETQRHQLKREINPTARIFKIGYSILDVQQIINELETE